MASARIRPALNKDKKEPSRFERYDPSRVFKRESGMEVLEFMNIVRAAIYLDPIPEHGRLAKPSNSSDDFYDPGHGCRQIARGGG